MRDKDIEGIAKALKQRIDHWLLVDLPGPRAASTQEIAQRIASVGLIHEDARQVQAFDTPSRALAWARERSQEGDRIVVFGSFLTVADVLANRRAGTQDA